MNHIITEIGDGVLEMKFDKRPDPKDDYILMVFNRNVKSKDHTYETNIGYIYAPKGAKSPYDIYMMMRRTNEYDTFDPAKSFTVIIHTKDKTTNEPIDIINCRLVRVEGESRNWEYEFTNRGKGEMILVFEERPKANEKYELWISGPQNGEYEDKHVPIKIPKDAKSPYVLPDVMMQVKEDLEDWR